MTMTLSRTKLVLFVTAVIALALVALRLHTSRTYTVYSVDELQSALPQDVIDKVKTLYISIGYARSGHSIIAALMDAHPHMVIADEYGFCTSPHRNTKTLLFNDLYQDSFWNAINGSRSLQHNEKGYTLDVANSWQGKYDMYVSVIGSKCGCGHFEDFLASYNEIKAATKIPIKATISIRNPFDLIATRVLYGDQGELLALMKKRFNVTRDAKYDQHIVSQYKLAMKDLKRSSDKKTLSSAMYDNPQLLQAKVYQLIFQTKQYMRSIEVVGHDNVLEIHNIDVVKNPLTVVKQMCVFFEVECSPIYIQSFVDKVFQSVSKSRELIVWPPRLQQMVENELIKKYNYFSRYSFKSD